MAATLFDIYTIRFSTTGIYHRTVGSVMKLADYILTTEDAATENHANRVIWATQTVANPPSKADQMMAHISVNGTILAGYDPKAPDEGVKDADIDYVVNTLCNTYATGA